MSNKFTTPWYESNIFWGPVSFGLSIILGLLAAKYKDLSWLVYVAAFCFVVGAVAAARQMKQPGKARLLLGVCVITISIGAYCFRGKLASANSTTEASDAAKSAQSSAANDHSNSGNISQTGNGNNAAVGNNNSVGNITVNPGPRLSGWLIPASKSFPDSGCPKPKASELALYMGTSVYLVDKFPATVISVAGVARLLLEKGPKGIGVTTDIFDDSIPRPKIIASIERNQITVNPNNFFKLDWSDDGSQLRVIDQYKDEVLNIHYLNKNAISLTAILRYPGVSGPITIGRNEISWEGIRVNGGADCYPTSGGADLEINKP